MTKTDSLEKLHTKSFSCWVVTEGLAGTENQCIGVAQALGITPEIKRISLNFPWNFLSPYLGFEQDFTFSPRLNPPWPDLVIASGRKSIAAARYIKRKSSGKTFVVQIQDPRIGSKEFDLVAVPAHDKLRGENVIVTIAAPNKITEEILKTAKTQFPHFESVRTPRIAVLIGGKSKAYNMTTDDAHRIAEQLAELEGGLMITCSRRTGPENQKILENTLNRKGDFFWNGDGPNPYLGILAWADYILVTADSVSMLSEACTTGKPVYMIDLPGGSKRIAAAHQNLIKRGAMHVFRGKLNSWTYPKLTDAQDVAKEIRAKFLSRRHCEEA